MPLISKRPLVRPMLVTERLTLRPFRAVDLAGFHEYFADPVVGRFRDFGSGPLEVALRPLTWRIDHDVLLDWGDELFLAVLGPDGIIGEVSVLLPDWEPGVAELGIALAREHQRRGYARELLPAVIEHVLETLPVASIRASVDTRDERGQRLFEDLGFTLHRYLPGVQLRPDAWCDEYQLEVSRHRWRASRPWAAP